VGKGEGKGKGEVEPAWWTERGRAWWGRERWVIIRERGKERERGRACMVDRAWWGRERDRVYLAQIHNVEVSLLTYLTQKNHTLFFIARDSICCGILINA
jgi:hypothetical protein